MTALVIRSDAAHLPLPDASVDLIVTSPPYFALRSYQDGGQHYAKQIGSEPTPQEFLEALWACTAEWMRVLKPSGSIFVNLGDSYAGSGKGGNASLNNSQKYLDERAKGYHEWTSAASDGSTGSGSNVTPNANASTVRRKRKPELARPKSLQGFPWRYALGCVDRLGLILRNDHVWRKSSGLPDTARDRARRVHEYVFHFVNSGRYYASPTELTSVWDMAPGSLRPPSDMPVHQASFPVELPIRCISSWAPLGGVVLDPFGGTGTTALCASVLGRIGISGDLSHDYSRLAAWRTTDPGQRAKAMRVEKPPVQLDGQADLFGGAA